MKRLILLAVAMVFFVFQIAVSSATALELSQDVRTVPVNEQGDTKVVSLAEFKTGQRLFIDSCSQCHLGGRTKTNPNVTLKIEDLQGAFPRRDNIAALVDYIKNPTTYDGFTEIYEFHPSTRSADIFPEMRNLTEDDLEAISGYMLVQPKVQGIMWGGGKAVS
ncbi:photosystem II cytochrome c-550 [Coleofasciculus sp.]|uniref:photosystem II cytochrome c-550 n=1 Tax=Coleofasciculus sp. TaxID=3100458 RepID=UPI0039FA6632